MTEFERGYLAALWDAAQETEAIAKMYAADKEDPVAPRIADIMRGRAASIWAMTVQDGIAMANRNDPQSQDETK